MTDPLLEKLRACFESIKFRTPSPEESKKAVAFFRKYNSEEIVAVLEREAKE